MSLDTDYANGPFIPDAETYPDRWNDAAAEHRQVEQAIGRARLNLSYCEDERQSFDLFLPAGKPNGLMVFVHGGYWLRFDRSSWSHFAAGAQAAGWACAMPSYRLAPGVGVPEITADVRAAIVAAAGRIQGPVVLTGHSAGGHLVARMLCADVALPPDVLARVLRVTPISPVSDLRPLLQTEMKDPLQLDQDIAVQESPCLHTPAHGVAVSVWVGSEERPVFLDQARWLAEAWPKSRLYHSPGAHHFDILDALAEAESPLMRSILGSETL